MIEIEAKYLIIIIVIFTQFILILWMRAIHRSDYLGSNKSERNFCYVAAILMSIAIWFIYTLIIGITVIT